VSIGEHLWEFRRIVQAFIFGVKQSKKINPKDEGTRVGNRLPMGTEDLKFGLNFAKIK